MEFEFVSDKTFKDILYRDYQELLKCREAKAIKSVLILCGSIVEALLTDYFIENLPVGEKESQILQFSLGDLLSLAESEKVISRSDKNLATVLKDYRNLIHPGREIRKKETFDHDSSEVAFQVLNILVKKIQIKYRERFNIDASEILKNLDNDWNFHSIYNIVITKLSNGEKEKLIDSLIELETRDKSKFKYFEDDFDYSHIGLNNIENIKDLVSELKPILKKETVNFHLKSLLDAVTSGQSLKALALYNLFYEEVGLLEKEDQDTISIYMLFLFTSIFEDSRSLNYEKTYSTIGKYIYSDKAKEQLKSLFGFSAIHFGGSSLQYEFDVLEQIINSLPEDLRKEVIEYLGMFLILEKGELPKDIYENFVVEAVKRKIIDYNTQQKIETNRLKIIK